MYQFTHITNMIKEDKDTFLELLEEITTKKEHYLSLINQFSKFSDCMIEFYELDSDDYGYPVVKYSVTFTPNDIFALKFRGYLPEQRYKLINKSTLDTEFEGNYYEITEYVNSAKFSTFTQEDLNNTFTTEEYIYDKYKEWTKKLTGVELIFVPDKVEN